MLALERAPNSPRGPWQKRGFRMEIATETELKRLVLLDFPWVFHRKSTVSRVFNRVSRALPTSRDLDLPRTAHLGPTATRIPFELL